MQRCLQTEEATMQGICVIATPRNHPTILVKTKTQFSFFRPEHARRYGYSLLPHQHCPNSQLYCLMRVLLWENFHAERLTMT